MQSGQNGISAAGKGNGFPDPPDPAAGWLIDPCHFER
jgi:hypothetical protein